MWRAARCVVLNVKKAQKVHALFRPRRKRSHRKLVVSINFVCSKCVSS
jgi:hypothetical protein